MKKYIKPAMECRMAVVESLLANSIATDESPVNGSQILGKYIYWDDCEEEE